MRIAVACIEHETNTFAPVMADYGANTDDNRTNDRPFDDLAVPSG